MGAFEVLAESGRGWKSIILLWNQNRMKSELCCLNVPYIHLLPPFADEDLMPRLPGEDDVLPLPNPFVDNDLVPRLPGGDSHTFVSLVAVSTRSEGR